MFINTSTNKQTVTKQSNDNNSYQHHDYDSRNVTCLVFKNGLKVLNRSCLG